MKSTGEAYHLRMSELLSECPYSAGASLRQEPDEEDEEEEDGGGDEDDDDDDEGDDGYSE
jgi:hypothetical protein